LRRPRSRAASSIRQLGGTHADFNFDLHAGAASAYIGVTFRTRSIEEIRDIFSEVRNASGRRGIAKTAIAIDKVFAFDISARLSSTWSQPAPRQDRGDDVVDVSRRGAAFFTLLRRAGTYTQLGPRISSAPP